MHTGELVTDLISLVDSVMAEPCEECAGQGEAFYGPSWRDDFMIETCHKCGGTGKELRQ
jgi:DnaJ-class molecular chaperone